jgi:hypothetical protein
MKLNATSEMLPVTWAAFSAAPLRARRADPRLPQALPDLETWLAEITGFAAVSLQPNAGSQGEYAGLLTIRAYHHSRGDHHRDVCLIPDSAHGTNPASAVIAGMRVVAVKCDANGNVDLERPARQGRRARRQPRGADGDLPLDARGLRGGDPRDLRGGAREHGGRSTWTAPTSTRRWASAAPATSARTSAT